MKTWNTPVLETLNVAMTESGAVPATYETSELGTNQIIIDGIKYTMMNGFLWESGMSMGEYTKIAKPFICDGNGNYTYYEGSF